MTDQINPNQFAEALIAGAEHLPEEQRPAYYAMLKSMTEGEKATEAPKPEPTLDVAEIQAQFAAEKSRLPRGVAFVDAVYNLRNKYRARYPGIEFDGQSHTPPPAQAPKPEPPELTADQESALRVAYRAEMQAAGSNNPMGRFTIQQKYARMGLDTGVSA